MACPYDRTAPTTSSPARRRVRGRRAHGTPARLELELADWNAGLPLRERLVFDMGHAVWIITPDIEHDGGWRITSFSKLDRKPITHYCHRTRLEALVHAAETNRRDPLCRIPRIPFQVEPLIANGIPPDFPLEK